MRKLSDEQWRVLMWSLARSTCLSDHVGDVWRGFYDVWKILGLPDFEEDLDGPSLDFIEKQGGKSLHALRTEWGDDPDA